MYRSGNSAGLGGAQPPNQFGLPQTTGTNYPPPPIQVKQRPQTGSGSHQSYNNNNNNDDYNSSYRRDDRQMQQQQRRGPPHSNRPQNRHDGTGSYEQEPAPEPLATRPIIKEEELNRMDSLAKDDGWSKCDEIDYNQKLVFSDDEDVPVKESKNDKKGNSNNRDAQRHEEDNRAGKMEIELRFSVEASPNMCFVLICYSLES